MLTTAASMIDQFNMPNIRLMKEAGYRVRAVCNFEQGNTCDEQRIQELESTLCRMGGAGGISGAVWGISAQWDSGSGRTGSYGN